jgi:molybdopterin molybdotransferase
LFLRPILDKMLERTRKDGFSPALLTDPLPPNGRREHYVRARMSIGKDARACVSPFEQQDSSLLSVFQDSNALIRLAPNARALEAGALVDTLWLERA